MLVNDSRVKEFLDQTGKGEILLRQLQSSKEKMEFEVRDNTMTIKVADSLIPNRWLLGSMVVIVNEQESLFIPFDVPARPWKMIRKGKNFQRIQISWEVWADGNDNLFAQAWIAEISMRAYREQSIQAQYQRLLETYRKSA